jgi:alpha/beta superfamily hydrolase|tara:strand:- start:47 stop:1141 length:1095 start_codon:yes stop_codon:yes gene_type:complete
MKKIYSLLFSILSSALIFAQCDGRYQTEIFNSTNVVTVNYSDVYSGLEHRMDIYTPDGDTVTNRPVVFYIHGGSFYSGDKSMLDCIDFCNAFAKRGYVAIAINHRLGNILSFLISNEEQYRTVIKAVADAKAAIRFMRKDHANTNTYGIDPSAIFIGGYSSGGVLAIHLAFIDAISDLPISPLNVQTIMNNNGGLEGDAGNNGFSSEVHGVISFAGGINNLNWIDVNDEPIVSVQGTNDLTVNYNCGPGLNNPAVLNLCGAGQIHPKADTVGIINDKLIFVGEGHGWGIGNINPKFLQAINFTSDFLYPLLPCNQITSVFTLAENEKKLLQIVNILGEEVSATDNIPLFYRYNDGTVEKKIILQ